MRKSDVEIMREVFGQGARWIGWNHWLKHQPIFKFIEHKVERGLDVLSTKDFFIRLTKEGHSNSETMMYAHINKQTGDLDSVFVPTYYGKGAGLTVWANRCRYNDGEAGKGPVDMNEMFEDPWRPTEDELDLFSMLYGNEQILIDMNKELYGTIMKYNRAAGANNVAIFYPVQ